MAFSSWTSMSALEEAAAKLHNLNALLTRELSRP